MYVPESNKLPLLCFTSFLEADEAIYPAVRLHSVPVGYIGKTMQLITTKSLTALLLMPLHFKTLFLELLYSVALTLLLLSGKKSNTVSVMSLAANRTEFSCIELI